MNWKVLLVGLALVGALTAMLASGFGKDPKALPSVLEGRMAPGFELQTLDGETVRLEDFRGSPLVLNFWATWCKPCAAEHPVLQEGAGRYQPRGVVFLGVVYADDAAKVAAYLERHGSAYPNALDATDRTAIDYGVGGVPETFFIDREGRIARKFSGPLDASSLQGILEEIL